MAFRIDDVFDMEDVMDGRMVIIRVFQCGDMYTFDNFDRWLRHALLVGTTMMYEGPVVAWHGRPLFFELWAPAAPVEDAAAPASPATPAKRIRPE